MQSLVNTELLKARIEGSGLKLSYIKDTLGLSYQALRNKIYGVSKFTAEEIAVLCRVLKITDLLEKEAIFFAKNVDKTPTNRR